MKYFGLFVIAIACLYFTISMGGANDYRTVVDSRGVSVEVPIGIERVVTISGGLVEGVMTSLDEQDKIVGLGHRALRMKFNYTYETIDGDTYSYKNGMNPVTYLNPKMTKLPLFADTNGINYESLAGLEPDLVIIRCGCGVLKYPDDENTQKTIDTIESLDIPVVVLYAPGFADELDTETISNEIRIIGQIFGKDQEAEELCHYLENQVDLVTERTNDIPDDEKQQVLILGLSSIARDNGGAGNVMGTDTMESYFIEEVVNAKNAYQEKGWLTMISVEHILALNPDVIVLCTSYGYHPPNELYSSTYYQNIQELDAIKNERVSVLPWTPSNGAKRLEYPIDVMVIAKASYPELFEDFDIGEWLLDFYQNVYNVDRETAKELRSAQWMDWVLEEDYA